MALDTKLILEALNERFAALEVMFDNFLNSGSKDSTAPASSSSPSKQGTAQEASKAVIADNWGGLFDGGDDLDTAVSNTASAESVGLHDVLVCDPASFDLDTAASNTASAESVGLHDFPCDDHDLAPPRLLNLVAPSIPLTIDAAATSSVAPVPSASTWVAPAAAPSAAASSKDTVQEVSRGVPAPIQSPDLGFFDGDDEQHFEASIVVDTGVGCASSLPTSGALLTTTAVAGTPSPAVVAASFSNSIFVNPCSERALEQQISVKDVISSTMPEAVWQISSVAMRAS